MKNFTVMLLMIFALGITSVMAQGRSVSGKVTDSGTGLPVVGAMVIVQGSSNGAYTLEGGEFIIANVEGAVNFEVSFMGYTESLVPVSAAQTQVNIELTPSAMQMDEVVVIAYGSADKKSLTGSVAVISSDDIDLRPITNAASAIAGMSAGITTTTASGVPGASPAIRIRGIGSINSNSAPLYVVDGVPYSGDIANIASDDIASMTVLKDAASTALYGSRASNGVIMIQTKTGRSGAVTFDVKINQGFMYRAVPEYDKLGATDFYELAWESARNASHFTGGNKMPIADAAASSSAFSADGNQWFNILTDNAKGTKMADSDVFIPKPWEGYSDQSWTRGSLNPNARIMDGYVDDFDWIKEGANIGYRQNYSIQASGGTEKTSYFTSVGYTDEDGYFDHTSYNRLNVRAKVDVTPTKWLKLGTNLSTSLSNSDNPYSGGWNGHNPWVVSREIAPIYPIHEHDYNTGKYILDANGDKKYDMGVEVRDEQGNVLVPRRGQYQTSNVYNVGELDKSTNSSLMLGGQAYAEITFLKDFKFTVDGAINYNYSYSSFFENSGVGLNQSNGGSASNGAYRYLNYTFKQMLNWGRSFGSHNVDILLGHENLEITNHFLSALKTGEIFPGSTELDNFSRVGMASGNSDLYRSEAYFGRANYNYDEKYYFSASYRRDGSSKFSPENRWGDFWSVGASWILSSEEFMSDVMWVDFLKVRASYGTNGNDGGFGSSYVGIYQWQSTYTPYWYLDSTNSALRMNEIGTPNLQWETSGALDVGVDFRLFNRLNGTIGYFSKSSDELIFDVPTPLSSGIWSTTMNVGSMTNRGIELSLDVDAFRTKDWVWNIGVNLTWIQNEITNLPGIFKETGVLKGSKKLMIGHSIYEYYLPQWAGVDATDGATYYVLDMEKQTGNEKQEFEKGGVWYTKTANNAFKDFSGDALSPINGSITSSLTWKSLTLDLLFTFRIGGKAFDSSYNTLMQGGTNAAWSSDMLNSWRKPGDVTELPRMEASGSSAYKIDSNTLIDNSYIALQNVTLSYQFPKKVANKLSLKGLSIYASGENLFQISGLKGYDAMSSFDGTSSYQRFGSMSTLSFGINVSF